MARPAPKFSLLQVAGVAFAGAFAGVLIGFLYFFPGAVHNSIREFQTLIVGGIAFILGIWGFVETKRRDHRLHERERHALMAACAAELLANVHGMEQLYWRLEFIIRNNAGGDESWREKMIRWPTVEIISATAGKIGILGPDLAGYVVLCSSNIADLYSEIQTATLGKRLLTLIQRTGRLTLVLTRELAQESGDTRMPIPENFPRAANYEAAIRVQAEGEAQAKGQPDGGHSD